MIFSCGRGGWAAAGAKDVRREKSKEVLMLSISLGPEQYVTIGENIVVKVSKMMGGRCILAIEADRSLPVVRGTVLERGGTPPPACIAQQPPPRKRRHRPDALFRWNSDRERAVSALQRVADRLEQNGSGDEARILRTQLEQIVPAAWEEEAVRN